MNTRNTRNSGSAAYDALSYVQESKEIPLESVSAPSEPSVASTALSSTSVVSPTSPAFLAIVANTVQQVLSAQQAASLPAWSVPTSEANSASVDAPSANLSGNHSSLLAAQMSLSPLLVLALHPLYRPWRLLLLQVGQITVLFLLLYRYPIGRSVGSQPAVSTWPFPRGPLAPHHLLRCRFYINHSWWTLVFLLYQQN